MPSVSVLTSTFRPGGIDILLAGMRDQMFRDFELVLVDRRYEYRHQLVVDLAKRYDINLIHVPEHRRNGKWQNIASAWNTALAVARGDIVIFLQDYQYTPPDWIDAHITALDGKRRYVLAPYVYTQMPELTGVDVSEIQKHGEEINDTTDRVCVELDPYVESGLFDEISVLKNGYFEPRMLQYLAPQVFPHQDTRVMYIGSGSKPCLKLNWVHIKNESILRSVAYELNGIDERLERGKGPMDTDWENRIRASDIEFWWCSNAMTVGPNPRVLFFTQPWGATHRRVEGRWSWDDGLAYAKRRVDEMHVGGTRRARNKYNMEDLALKLELWRSSDVAPKSIDVADLTYWNCEMWPDTP